MSILDAYGIREDLELELGQNRKMPTDQWWTAFDDLTDRAEDCIAAEAAQLPEAYDHYIKLARVALLRAYRLCDARRVPGKEDL